MYDLSSLVFVIIGIKDIGYKFEPHVCNKGHDMSMICQRY